MGYPTRLLVEGETLLRSFHPHWKMLLGPALWVLGGITASVLLATRGGLPGPDLVYHLVVWVPVVVVAGGGAASYFARQYVLTSRRLIVRDGILRRSGTEIPLEQINTVSFSQSLTERLLGFGDVVIESASTGGQSRLDNIPDPQGFQSEIYATRDALATARRRESGQDQPEV